MSSTTMKHWKSKLFGDTRCNFSCWIVAGTALITVSLLWVIEALVAGARSPECRLLLAIYVVLLGQFVLGLQTYSARTVKNLELKENEEVRIK
jgi:hypothetical protein